MGGANGSGLNNQEVNPEVRKFCDVWLFDLLVLVDCVHHVVTVTPISHRSGYFLFAEQCLA